MAEPWVIAHRGGTAFGPENTLLTMQKSIEHGVDGIELDVRCCATGEPVIIHDATIERTTDGIGEIGKLTLDQLKAKDAGGGQSIPTLLEVLRKIDHRTRLFLEVKHPKAALPAAKLVNYYVQEKGWNYTQLIMISRFHQLLVQIHHKYPKIILGASLENMPEGLAACGEYTNSTFVLPKIDIITQDFMDDAHKRNLDVITWTCDDATLVERARAWGVRGIITGDPALVKKQDAA